MENKPKKFIDFIITQKCTYSCKYCSQSKSETKNKNIANKKTIDSFLNFIKNLEKDWEITITGGEAILHPNFYEIISEIKKLNFKINLITNFSFSLEIYRKVFDILDNSLNRYDISFHLDEIVNFEQTLYKLEKFINLKPQNTKTTFLIPIYNIDDKKEKQIEKIIKIAKKYNINYDFQHIRFLNTYSKIKSKEEKYLNKEKPNKTFSHLCFAGKYSFVIYEDGEAYRCYSSRLLKSNSLGNINNKDFKLSNKPMPCLHSYCTCPKPKLYGQITSTKKPLQTLILNIRNIFYTPALIFKKRDIIVAKIKQKLN